MRPTSPLLLLAALGLALGPAYAAATPARSLQQTTELLAPAPAAPTPAPAASAAMAMAPAAENPLLARFRISAAQAELLSELYGQPADLASVLLGDLRAAGVTPEPVQPFPAPAPLATVFDSGAAGRLAGLAGCLACCVAGPVPTALLAGDAVPNPLPLPHPLPPVATRAVLLAKVKEGDAAAAEALLAGEANPNVPDAATGETPLFAAVEQAASNPNLLQLLLVSTSAAPQLWTAGCGPVRCIPRAVCRTPSSPCRRRALRVLAHAPRTCPLPALQVAPTPTSAAPMVRLRCRGGALHERWAGRRVSPLSAITCPCRPPRPYRRRHPAAAGHCRRAGQPDCVGAAGCWR